ncbi:MAG TPA: anti-sigma factor [Sphingomicrobium sp.]|nr:anti-sigma factor [Sphingomicrobium sp.]
MTADDEKFFAWLDGELSGPEASEMEAKVAADPRLASLADQHRALSGRLRTAFESVEQTPISERITAAVRTRKAGVIDFGAAPRSREVRRPAARPAWMAMAAALVLGLALGLLLRAPSNAPFKVQDGGMYAAMSLERALDTQLASAPVAGNVRIGVTFRDQAGGICRSFTSQEASGLACRDDGGWRVRGFFAAPEGQDSEYRMARGMDPNLAGLIDTAIAGDPLDAAQERAAKQNGWR